MFFNKIYKYFNEQPKPNTNKIYDEYFPPTSDSIFSIDRKGNKTDIKNYKIKKCELLEKKLKKLVWKRLSEIPDFDKFSLFPNEIHSCLFNQGLIGDCYCIDAISGLSNYGQTITQIFKTLERNDNGYYEVILFIDGEFQIVYVDDYLVFYLEDENVKEKNISVYDLAFASPHKNNNSFYLLLLEKIWAKINGGFSNIITGFTNEVTETICACQTKYFNPPNFNLIQDSLIDKFYQVSSFKSDHAYTIINVSEDEIVLRNPHGTINKIEDSITDKDLVGLIINKQEFCNYGKIRLKKSDYLNAIDKEEGLNKKFFKAMEISYIPYGKIIYSYYLNSENEKFFVNRDGNSFFEVEIDEPTTIDISVFSAKKRFNRNLFVGENDFMISVYDYNNHRIKFNPKMIQELNLQKGKYIIKIHFNFRNAEPYNFNEEELQEAILSESLKINSKDRGDILGYNNEYNEDDFENELNKVTRNKMEEIYKKLYIKKIHKFTLMIYSLKKLKLLYLESSNLPNINKYTNINYVIPEKNLNIERREYIFQPKSKHIFEFAKGITKILNEIGYVIDMDGKGQYIQKIITDEVETVVISDKKKRLAKVIDYDKIKKMYVEYDESRRGDKDEKDGIISTVYDENGVRVRKLIITEDIELNKQKIKNALKSELLDDKNYKIIINSKSFHEEYPDIDVLEAKKTKYIAELKSSRIFTKFTIGGVGFETQVSSTIKNFNSLLYPEQLILFPCVRNDMEEEIIKIVSRIILPEIKLNSIDQIWSTILYELTLGFLIYRQIPSISLSFNNDNYMYPCMNDFYKNTLIGHIIFFLDFFLKSFITGGTFFEEFIYNWEKDKNNNLSYLQQNFIDLKKYLYEQNLSDLDFDILLPIDEHILDFKGENNVFHYKFRIIGKMNEKLKTFENILFPELNHTINGEMYISPIVFNYNEDDYKPKISDFNCKAKKEKLLIYLTMEKIPYFQGYFFLLNLITFAIHYLPSLVNKGQFPDLSHSLHNQNKIYTKNLPKILPHVPIVHKKNIESKMSFKKILDLISPKLKKQLFSEIKENKEEQITLSEELKKNLEKEINEKYRNHLKKMVNDSEEIDIRNNNDLKINALLNFFFSSVSNLNMFWKKLIELLYQNLLNLQKKVKDKLNSIQNKYEGEIKKNNFKNLKEKLNYMKLVIDILSINIQNYYDKSINLINKKLDDQKTKELQDLSNKYKKDDTKNNDSKNDKIPPIFIFANRFLIFNSIQYSTKKEQVIKKYEYIKNNSDEKILENYDEETKSKIISMKNQYHNDLNTQKVNFINFKLELKQIETSIFKLSTMIDKSPLDFSDIIFKEEQNFNFTIKKASFLEQLFSLCFWSREINGGCLVNINKEIYSQEVELESDYINEIREIKNSQFFQSKKTKEINPEKYLIFKTKLIRGTFGQNELKAIVGIDDEITLNQNDLVDKDNLEKISKKSGMSLGYCKILSRDKNIIDSITNEELKQMNKCGENIEMLAVLNSNEVAVSRLLQRDDTNFEIKNSNDVTPLMYAVILKKNKISKLLIEKSSRKNINAFSETRLSALHYAVANNSTEIVQALINKDAKINSRTREKGITPFHIAAKKGYIDIISIFSNKINDISSIKGTNKQTPFFSAVKNSLLASKLFLKNYKHKLDTYDIDKKNAAYYSLIHGRYDIYLLCKSNHIKLNDSSQ